MLRLGDNFISSLNKVYGLYTLGFLGFVILMAILEVAGVSNTIIGWLFVALRRRGHESNTLDALERPAEYSKVNA